MAKLNKDFNPRYVDKSQKSKKKTNDILTPEASKITEIKESLFNIKWYWLVPLVATLLVYIPSLMNDFVTNWDDGGYIHQHDLVHSINWKNFYDIFFNSETFFYKGNYHPLTTFFYAIEYYFVQENAFLYHFNNLWIHLVNVFLVFRLVQLLKGNKETAAFVALLFGIHPMHVESVAWISERKDVLYAFFFLLTLIYYIKYYLKTDNPTKRYVLAIVFFLLSLLSKSAAVSLPGVLILFDLYFKRKFDIKYVLDKLPFFILSLLFGVLAVKSQAKAGAIQDLEPMFSVLDRFFLASYATMQYLIKFFVPIGLSAMHPYPQLTPSGGFEMEYYIAPIVVFVFLAAVLFSLRKTKDVMFGVLFFFITIILVLQIIPVGGAIIAERYSYIPYIGLFFVIGKSLEFVSTKYPNYRKQLITCLVIFSVVMGAMTIDRISAWKRGDALFADVNEKYPNMPFGYNNLGYYYYTKITDVKKPENPYTNYKGEKITLNEVLALYNKCLSLDTTFHMAYSNRGVLLFNINKFPESLADFDKALRIKPSNKDALIGKANTLSSLARYSDAIEWYKKYLDYKPEDDQAWQWLGTAYYRLNKFEESLKYFNEAINRKPDNSQSFYWRGLAQFSMNKLDIAIPDFLKAIEIKPDNPEPYTWLAWAYFKKNNYEQSIVYFNKATELKPNDLFSYKFKGHAYYNLKKYNEAIMAYSAAIQLNPREFDAIESRSHTYYELKMYREAFQDIEAVRQMGVLKDGVYYNLVKSKI
ncbi:MAG: tetratricopeptide repeat protein [Bacteroidota bacterium]